jgi:hypothetical protein
MWMINWKECEGSEEMGPLNEDEPLCRNLNLRLLKYEAGVLTSQSQLIFVNGHFCLQFLNMTEVVK